MYVKSQELSNEEDEISEDDAKKAKEFQNALLRINKLNEDYCKVKKISICNQLIETVIERLLTMVLMTAILFAYFDNDRLGHLIGLSLKDGYYTSLVVFTFACGLYGLINPLIQLRFVVFKIGDKISL